MDYNDGIALAIALDFFMGDAFFRALDQHREQKNQVAVQHFFVAEQDKRQVVQDQMEGRRQVQRNQRRDRARLDIQLRNIMRVIEQHILEESAEFTGRITQMDLQYPAHCLWCNLEFGQ